MQRITIRPVVQTPLGVMGDFRADNMLMLESPYTAFDTYNADLGGLDLVEQFFRPFYSNCTRPS